MNLWWKYFGTYLFIHLKYRKAKDHYGFDILKENSKDMKNVSASKIYIWAKIKIDIEDYKKLQKN